MRSTGRASMDPAGWGRQAVLDPVQESVGKILQKDW